MSSFILSEPEFSSKKMDRPCWAQTEELLSEAEFSTTMVSRRSCNMDKNKELWRLKPDVRT